MELEIKAIEGCPDDEYADWVELHITREQRWFEIARLLMHEEPADLVGVLFDGWTSCSTSAGALSTRPAARRVRRAGSAR
jgi:hypothetical protein